MIRRTLSEVSPKAQRFDLSVRIRLQFRYRHKTPTGSGGVTGAVRKCSACVRRLAFHCDGELRLPFQDGLYIAGILLLRAAPQLFVEET